jgi:hypothetical protein
MVLANLRANAQKQNKVINSVYKNKLKDYKKFEKKYINKHFKLFVRS